MNKLLLSFMALVMSLTTAYAGKFHMDLRDQAIPDSNPIEYFGGWFKLDKETSFEKTRDYTDELGFRHQNFGQTFAGAKVQDAIVMVHSKDGKITYVNGMVAEAGTTPDPAQFTLRSADDFGSELVLALKKGDDGEKWVAARKVYDAQKNAIIIIDASTGEVISTNSFSRHVSQVQVEAETYFDSIQTVTVEHDEANGTYSLMDDSRRIYTYDATDVNTKQYNAFCKDFDEADYATTEEAQAAVSNAETQMLKSCINFAFKSTPLKDDEDATIIQSVYLETSGDWWKTSEDSEMRFYIALYDKNEDLVAVSDTMGTDDELPYNFELSYKGGRANPGSSFLVRNYVSGSSEDPIGSDVAIDSTGYGSFTWDDGKTSGKYGLISLGQQAVSAHWGVAKSYDFYKEIFKLNGYDGNNKSVVVYVNPKTDNNAFTAGCNNATAHYFDIGESGIHKYATPYIEFGMGDGEKHNPFTELDITGHEYTHLVTGHNGNGGLNDNGEPAALDESFSDIMGYCIKQYAFNETNDYLTGTRTMIGKTNMTSMADPKKSEDGANPCPDTYGGQYWIDPKSSTDRGGCHTNCMVQSKWFYLLCEGGSGTNDNGDAYSVTGIGIEKARKIVYRNMMKYIMPESDFAAARAGSLSAAIDLHGSDTQEYRSVMDAWHAVGVGWNSAVEETEAADDFSVYASSGSIHISCPDERSIAVYALDGSRVYSDTAAEVAIDVNDGLYIVVVGNKAVKIEVRG